MWNTFWKEMQLRHLAAWWFGYLAWFCICRFAAWDSAADVNLVLWLVFWFTVGWTFIAYRDARKKFYA